MAEFEVKNFDTPDERRPFQGKGWADVIEVGGRAVARSVYEPGWKWSVNVKPHVGTDTCEIFHLGYIISGQIKVTMDNGDEAVAGPGAVFSIPPGHSGEVVGDESCVWVDFGDVENYAKAGS